MMMCTTEKYGLHSGVLGGYKIAPFNLASRLRMHWFVSFVYYTFS